MQKNIKKILLTGGGTGGSVAPLLAIVQELCKKETGETKSPIGDLVSGRFKFLWLGTKRGPEQEMVAKNNIEFKAIVSGKLRRYFSLKNFIDPFLILVGFVQAFFIIIKLQPNLVISAGSFIGVPIVWAAWVLHVPILIHQQDARPGLANKLMAPFARIITVTFEKSLKDYGKKAVWTGNLVRNEIRNLKFEIEKVEKEFRLKKNLPVILILGGGTGALAINKLVEQSLEELTKFCQIIHITGKGKLPNYQPSITNYQHFEFFNIKQITMAYRIANLVVSRCGMGVLTELSYLGKPAILIPIPDSHQEDNAEIFYQNKASLVLDQNELTSEKFVINTRRLLDDKKLQDELSNNIRKIIKRGANKRIAEIIRNLVSGTRN